MNLVLEECLAVRGLAELVLSYAREFFGQNLAVMPNATVQGCIIGKLSNDRVVTVGDGSVICVWSVQHAKQNAELVMALELAGHTDGIFEIDCSLDCVIVSSSRDCTARVWNGDTGECVYKLSHPHWVIDALAISAGKFATSCIDDHIRVWDSEDCVGMAHVNAYMLTALSDGQFASCTFDDVMHVWGQSSSLVGTLVDSNEVMVMQMSAFSDEPGNIFATHDSSRIYVWKGSEYVLGIENDTSELCAIGGGLLAAGSPDGTVRVWNVHTGHQKWTLTGHTSIVWSLAPMPNGMLASGSMDCTVRVWDLTTGRCVYVLSGMASCVKKLCATTHNLTALGIDCTMCVWE
jgi:WD40 repeat protein